MALDREGLGMSGGSERRGPSLGAETGTSPAPRTPPFRSRWAEDACTYFFRTRATRAGSALFQSGMCDWSAPQIVTAQVSFRWLRLSLYRRPFAWLSRSPPQEHFASAPRDMVCCEAVCLRRSVPLAELRNALHGIDLFDGGRPVGNQGRTLAADVAH